MLALFGLHQKESLMKSYPLATYLSSTFKLSLKNYWRLLINNVIYFALAVLLSCTVVGILALPLLHASYYQMLLKVSNGDTPRIGESIGFGFQKGIRGRAFLFDALFILAFIALIVPLFVLALSPSARNMVNPLGTIINHLASINKFLGLPNVEISSIVLILATFIAVGSLYIYLQAIWMFGLFVIIDKKKTSAIDAFGASYAIAKQRGILKMIMLGLIITIVNRFGGLVYLLASPFVNLLAANVYSLKSMKAKKG